MEPEMILDYIGLAWNHVCLEVLSAVCSDIMRRKNVFIYSPSAY